jgi:hypothetical protein
VEDNSTTMLVVSGKRGTRENITSSNSMPEKKKKKIFLDRRVYFIIFG